MWLQYGAPHQQTHLKRMTHIHPAVLLEMCIRDRFSTVVYQSYAKGWHPEDFYKGIRGYDKLDYQSYDINENEIIIKERALIAPYGKHLIAPLHLYLYQGDRWSSYSPEKQCDF